MISDPGPLPRLASSWFLLRSAYSTLVWCGYVLEGRIVGVFGTDPALKGSFFGSVAKKSEAEGTLVLYHKMDSGVLYSFLDDVQFPEKIQGCSRIASISDYAYYILPRFGKMTPPDGEMAVLLDSSGVDGSMLSIDEEPPQGAASLFKGTRLEAYPVEKRSTESSVIDLSRIQKARGFPSAPLVYIDRAFSVKGVGVVVLGFVLGGKISVHDQLRLIPSTDGKRAEVRGIQVNDVDHESVERGVRVGLSLRGVELKDLAKVSWMDDGSIETRDSLSFEYRQSGFYKQPVDGRDMHLQLPGEIVTCKLKSEGTNVVAALSAQAPVWEGMRVCVVDLNGKGLRVAGGGTCNLQQTL
jgi:selenocysteine-specific translation elongation factor